MIAHRIWLSGDLNQAESRIVAWKAPVPRLRQWYHEGRDVHSMVGQRISRVIQATNITMPMRADRSGEMFKTVHPDLFSKTTAPEERDIAKRTVHGSNYDMMIDKLALVLGVPREVAEVIYKIYHGLFPEIKRDYHGWCLTQLTKHKCIWTPEPVRFRKVFHGVNSYEPIDSDTLRSAYSCYPQCTVGAILARVLNRACTVFVREVSRSVAGASIWSPIEELRPIWEMWYGDNYDAWTKNVNRHDPLTILRRGVDVRMDVHDSINISTPNDSVVLQWAASILKEAAEMTLVINDDLEWGRMIIPMDFKIGLNLLDMHDFKLEAVHV